MLLRLVVHVRWRSDVSVMYRRPWEQKLDSKLAESTLNKGKLGAHSPRISCCFSTLHHSITPRSSPQTPPPYARRRPKSAASVNVCKRYSTTGPRHAGELSI